MSPFGGLAALLLWLAEAIRRSLGLTDLDASLGSGG